MKERYESRIGSTLADRYEITGLMGVGGMGAVFRARQAPLSREVALKIIGSHLTDHPQALDRFRREAEIVAGLSHPNVVTVYDFGQTPDGEQYLAMELLEGETLAERIRRTGPLPWGDTLPIVRSVAAALAKAHHSGVVHRDLKPDNIMLTGDGTGQVVKVLDFGVARFTLEPNVDEFGRPLTGAGVIVGSPGYLAPEALLDSREVTARADLYGLGLVGLEMLRGRPVFEGASPAGILLSNAQAGGTPLETLAVEVALPGALHHLLSTLLQPYPAQRPRDGGAFLALLDEAIAALQGTPMPTSSSMAGSASTLLYANRSSIEGAPSPAPYASLPGNVPTAAGTLAYASMPSSQSPSAPPPVGAQTATQLGAPSRSWVMMVMVAIVAGVSAAAGAGFAFSRDTGVSTVAAANAPTPEPQVVIIRKTDDDDGAKAEPAASADRSDDEVAKATANVSKKAKQRRRPRRVATATKKATVDTATAAEPETAREPMPEPLKPLTSSAIRSGLRINQGSASKCTNTNLVAKGHGVLVDHCPSYPTLSGTHRMEIDIAPDGSVVSASFLSQVANAAKIGNCVLDSVQSWTFPASTEGARRVRLPVDFAKCVPINGKCVFDGDS
jgi:serine/threonine protein kinase